MSMRTAVQYSGVELLTHKSVQEFHSDLVISRIREYNSSVSRDLCQMHNAHTHIDTQMYGCDILTSAQYKEHR